MVRVCSIIGAPAVVLILELALTGPKCAYRHIDDVKQASSISGGPQGELPRAWLDYTQLSCFFVGFRQARISEYPEWGQRRRPSQRLADAAGCGCYAADGSDPVNDNLLLRLKG